MKRSRATPLAAVARIDEPSLPIARIGRLAGLAPGGHPLVEFEGNEDGPLPAVLATRATPEELGAAARRRGRVVLLFDGGDPRRPIVVGLVVEPEPAPRLVTEATAAALPAVATVDGERVCIEGADEIVLRCGKASITLRRNGKVVIRGAYLESHAEGTNRIKGGSVQIN